jgi:hypothetical protein
MRKGFLAALAGCGVGILAGAAAALAYLTMPPPMRVARDVRPAWEEIDWPFPMDQWGPGKAFRCRPRDCGTQIDLYLRAKIGFCNCTTGIADDEELERVSDLDLFGEHRHAPAPGHGIAVRWMKGRGRDYAFSGPPRDGRAALAMAFNDRCDVVVATVVAGDDRPGGFESAALAFLNGDTAMRWVGTALGL